MEPPNTSEPKWDLLLILPNLKVKVPTPFVTDHLLICGGMDPLLASLDADPANITMKELARRFASSYGHTFEPSCMLVRRDAPGSVRTADAITAFRDASCAAVITYTPHFLALGQEHRWEQMHSDHFEFWPDVAAPGGVLRKGTIVTGWTDEIDKFRGHPSPLIERPNAFDCNADRVLLKRLLEVWETVYIGGSDSQPARQLFRALEVVFHAGRYPASRFLGTSITDVGMRISLWISAFEVLLHPGGDEVRKSHVLDGIRRTEWADASPLRETRFNVRISGTDMPATFAEKVYDELYEARNDFLHGNPVTIESLLLRCAPKRPPLAIFAPLLFNIALRSFLAATFPRELTDDEQAQDCVLGFGEIEASLVATLNGREGPA